MYPSPWLTRSVTVWRADVHCATGTRVATLVARRFDLRKLWVTAASWSSCDNPLIVPFDKVTRVRLYCLQEMRKIGHLPTHLIIHSQVQIRLESSATSMLLTWFIWEYLVPANGSNIKHMFFFLLNQSQCVNAYNHSSTDQLFSNYVINIQITSAFFHLLPLDKVSQVINWIILRIFSGALCEILIVLALTTTG